MAVSHLVDVLLRLDRFVQQTLKYMNTEMFSRVLCNIRGNEVIEQFENNPRDITE
jgi:hypothetical protein